VNEFECFERIGIDALEGQIFLLESRSTVLDTTSDVACLGSKEDIEDELTKVDDGKDIVDPAVADILSHETHQERSSRWTESNQKRPDAHLRGPLTFEEALGDDSATNICRTDEESDQRTADCHRGIAMADRATNVADSRYEGGDEPYRTATVAISQRLPDEWTSTKDCDLQGGQVGGAGDGSVEIHGDVLIGRYDTCGNESGHT